MNPPKVKMYDDIHKGLRHLIAKFLFQAGATDWLDAESVERLRVQWELVKLPLHTHHKHEDEFIHPLLARISPGGHRSYQEEHEQQQVVLEELDAHFQRLVNGEVQEANRLESGLEFYRSFYLFYAEYLFHLHSEETDAQYAMERLCQTEEMGQVLGSLIASIPMDELLESIDFMFPAMNIHECAMMLGSMKAGAPPEVFKTLSDRAHKALDEEDWSKISKMLDI